MLKRCTFKTRRLRESDFYTTQIVAAMLARLRQQIGGAFGRRPNSNETEDVSFPVPELPAFPNIDLGKGNTTSVVKVSPIFCTQRNYYVFEILSQKFACFNTCMSTKNAVLLLINPIGTY